MKISIIIPSIRPHKWKNVLDSVEKSTTRDFEIIFVGPTPNLDIITDNRIKFVKDMGSPNRCQQIGLVNASGNIVTHFADDCVFREGMIDKCVDKLLEFKVEENHVVLTKYTEGNEEIQSDNYYKLIYAYPFSRNISPDWWIFNSAFLWRRYLIAMGGWDAENFDVPCIAHADLAIRCQRAQIKVHFIKESICHCTHMPMRTGDHGPIHDAQEQHDAPLYKKIHDTEPNRCLIRLDNWIRAEPVWSRRYKI